VELVTTQGVSWQQNTICICAGGDTSERWYCTHDEPRYQSSPSPGAQHNVLSREEVKSNFYVSYRIVKK